MRRGERDPLENAYNGGLGSEPPDPPECPEPGWFAWSLLAALVVLLGLWWLV